MYKPCVFPMFPPVHYQLFPPVCPDCSWCSECVTCERPPAVGPTLSTQKQSVLFTRFPVPCVFQIVCYLCAPYCLLGSQFPFSPIVLSMFLVCSQLCPVFLLWSQLFPVFPIESSVADVFPLILHVCPYYSQCVPCSLFP